MKEGLYRARFIAAGHEGDGLVVLSHGRIWGGDMMIYYTGKYTATDGGLLEADVKVDQHAQPDGFEFVLGRARNRIRFEGEWSGDEGSLQGRSDQAPGIVLKVQLSFLSD